MPITKDEYEAMHWQQIKKACEDAGIEYKGKEQAIDALLSLQPVEPPPAPAGDTPPADATPPDTPPPAEDTEPALKGPRLDKKMPYGDVFGDVDGAPGARYIQNGELFNAAGEKVG